MACPISEYTIKSKTLLQRRQLFRNCFEGRKGYIRMVQSIVANDIKFTQMRLQQVAPTIT